MPLPNTTARGLRGGLSSFTIQISLHGRTLPAEVEKNTLNRSAYYRLQVSTTT